MSEFAISDAELEQIGAAAADLPPMTARETPLNQFPPAGAGRLVEVTDDALRWEPLSELEWRNLTNVERGRIVIERGVQWLSANAKFLAAPVSYVEVADEQVNRLFGLRAKNLHEAMCGAYRQVRAHETDIELALLALAGLGLLSIGVHVATIGGHVALVLVKEYGRRKCE